MESVEGTIATRDFPVTSVDNILKWPNAEPPYFGRLRAAFRVSTSLLHDSRIMVTEELQMQ